MPLIAEPLPDRPGIVMGPTDPGFRAFSKASFSESRRSSFGQATSAMIARGLHTYLKGETFGAGRTLSPEEAQEEFGVPGLSFKWPINETVARMMMEDRLAQIRNQEVIRAGSRTFGRKSWGFLMGVLGQMSDFPTVAASVVFPGVKGAQAATTVGKGALVGAKQALIQEGIMEAFIITDAKTGQRDYTFPEAVANIAFSVGLGALGGGVGGALKSRKLRQTQAKTTRVNFSDIDTEYVSKIPTPRKRQMQAATAADLINDRPVATPGRMATVDPRMYDPDFHVSAKKRLALAELKFLKARDALVGFNRVPEPPMPNKPRFFKSVKGKVSGEEAIAQFNEISKTHRDWATRRKNLEKAAKEADRELARARDLVEEIRSVDPEQAPPKPVSKMSDAELKAELEARSGGEIKKSTSLPRNKLESEVEARRAQAALSDEIEKVAAGSDIEKLSTDQVRQRLNEEVGLTLKKGDQFDEDAARGLLARLDNGESLESISAEPRKVIPDRKYAGKQAPQALKEGVINDVTEEMSPEWKRENLAYLHRRGREPAPKVDEKASRALYDDQYDVRAADTAEELKVLEDDVRNTLGDQADEFIDSTYKMDDVQQLVEESDLYKKALSKLIPCMIRHS